MNDNNLLQRVQTLADEYQYNYTYIEPFAMVDTLPQGENFSLGWKKVTGKQVLKLIFNTLKVNLAERINQNDRAIEDSVRGVLWQTFLQTLQEKGKSFKPKLVRILIRSIGPAQIQLLNRHSTKTEVTLFEKIQTALERLLREEPFQEAEATSSLPTEVKMAVWKRIDAVLQKLPQGIPATEAEVERFANSPLIERLGEDFLITFVKNLQEQFKKIAPKGRASSLADYRKLFDCLQLPKVADEFQKDEVFAYMRVAGPNPLMIARMTAPDPRFPVTEEHYKSEMGDSDSLQEAIEQGRIYLADYASLDGASNGTFGIEPQVQKYSYAPIAMFAVPANAVSNRLLRPVAIQCGQTPTDYPIITRATGLDAWLMAKTIVQIADANFHEAVSHLARTHLLVEPFIIATHRQLPSHHPLFKLLVPHFQGTLAINRGAHKILAAPGGGVNELLSSTIDYSRVLVVKGFQARGFNADMLPRRLQERGVDDRTALPVYPYRDDGLLIWGAIRDWVKAYLNLYYSSDAAIQIDRPLQSWAKELVAFDGGRLADFGDGNTFKIETLEYAIDAVTMVIFTASAQHAAVNFPQNDIMSFAPAMPTAGYATAKGIGAKTTERDWLDLLPPLELALQQLNLLYLLGSVYYTRLGDYVHGHFTDLRVAEPLQAFQKQLHEIENIIDRRNADRPPYNYLKPSKIPQSTNI